MATKSALPGIAIITSNRAERLRVLVVIVGVTLLTRAWTFGDIIQGDEQFYLLVGRQMTMGALPYVDIFDVKPIGLFLIYALANRLVVDPVWGYQLLAALSVCLTACVLFTIARRLTSFAAALGAACAYVAWLTVFQGIGGQSPVFYNLPMTCAAALLMRAVASDDDNGLTMRGAAIMLLTGAALQIKYTVVFEGLFFGLALLWLGSARGWSIGALASNATLWVGCALAPTLAAFLTYAEMGHAAEFAQDNFLSFFNRNIDRGQFLTALARLAAQLIALSPFWCCAAIARRRLRSAEGAGRREIAGLFGWAGAAVLGYLLGGTWSEHFVMPLLAPLSLLGAFAIDAAANRKGAVMRLVGIGLIAGFGRSLCERATEGGKRDIGRVAQIVAPYLGRSCLYVINAPSSLYLLTNSCLPSRYVFPSHLLSQKYAGSLGSDPRQEMRLLLARRPAAIVMGRPYANPNRVNQRVLGDELERSYRFLTQTRIGVRPVLIFIRKPDLATTRS